MDETYKLIADLAKELVPPADGILSRTLFANDRLKAVGFGFAAGEELSEHTAAVPAVLHVLSGEATLTLGGDRRDVGAGAWAHMPARLPHSIQARTPVTMLLLLLK
ncbi:MAG: cupin domain-containing protein [Planctomycetes bacterium]|nr:cupin domain-containing protein [Planctomycetota bacterium]